MTIAQRIKQARTEANLTMKQLASMVHVSGPTTIARYESGVHFAGSDIMQKIAAATGKPLGWFYCTDNCEETAYSSTINRCVSTLESLNEDDLQLVYDFALYLLQTQMYGGTFVSRKR